MNAQRKRKRPLPRMRIKRVDQDNIAPGTQRTKDPEVGYGRPPRAHQFKPGQSGNPKGRPKGSKNESTILREIMNRKLETHSGGRRKKVTLLEAVLLRMIENALKGDLKSATFLLNRYAAMVSGEIKPSDLSEDDREVLEAFARRLTAQRPAEEG